MFKMPEKIEYSLPENIGNPWLFTGRKEEFDFFLGDWYMTLEGHFAQNQAILSRRKKGKSAFMQRLFNIFWSAGAEKSENDLKVIPFYYSIKDVKQTLRDFTIDFFPPLFVSICLIKPAKRNILMIRHFNLSTETWLSRLNAMTGLVCGSSRVKHPLLWRGKMV